MKLPLDDSDLPEYSAGQAEGTFQLLIEWGTLPDELLNLPPACETI